MKLSPALGWITAALMLCSLSACQKKAENQIPAPASPAAATARRLVSAEPNSFDAIAKHLDSGGGLYFYLSTESFMKAASEKLTEAATTLMDTAKMDPVQKANAQAAWQSLSHFTSNSGIKDITGLGVSSIALEPGYYQNKWMLHHYPGKGNGLIWNLSNSTPNALDFASYLPETTALATSENFKLAPVWNALEQEAATNPELRQGITLLTQQVKQSTGLDLGSALASLGPNYSIVVTLDEKRMTNIPGPNGNMIIPEPAIAIFIQTQDDLIIDRINQELSKLPMITQSTEGDLKVRTLSVPLPFPFVRPMIAWKKGLLIISSNEQLVRDMMDVKAGRKQGLAASANFKKLMTGLPNVGCSFSYVAPSLQKTVNEIQMTAMQQNGAAKDPALQKLIQTIQSAAPQGAVAHVTENTPEGFLSTSHGGAGHTQIAAVGTIVPVAILAGVALPAVTGAQAKAHLVSSMSNARQIHLATISMATDGVANNDSKLGWPGDLKANGTIQNLSDFVTLLVRNDYLKPSDLKVFSATGWPQYPGNGRLTSGSNGILTPSFTDEYCAFKIYLVKDADPADTIFMASKNFTYGKPLDPQAKPYGDKGFVIIHKGGDATTYKKDQALNFGAIGKLPGGGTVESAENCLNPGP